MDPPSAIEPQRSAPGIVSAHGRRPSGTRHAISPLVALIAASVPHGGGVHGNPVLEQQKAPDDTVRRASLRMKLELTAKAAGLPLGINVLACDEADLRSQIVHGHDQQIVDSIMRDAAPRHPAHIAGHHKRSLQRRRCEKSLGTQPGHRLATPGAILVSGTPGVLGVEREWRKRLRRVGNGWVFAATSPGTSLFGTGRSWTGISGLPVSRFRMNRWPVFDATATAAIVLPSFRQSNRIGGEATS